MYSNGKFKRGDYVLRVDGENFKSGYKMKNVYSIADKESVVVSELSGIWRNEDIRHATQEEVYWMGQTRHGGLERDFVGDFKEGDVIASKDGYHTIIEKEYVHRFNDKGVLQNMKGIYPAETFKRYPQEEE